MSKNQWINFPFIIRPENIARYEEGDLLILDRRCYPFEVKFVRCKTYEDTARAIEDMVTQSGGPALASGFGMVQAAHQASDLSKDKQSSALKRAAKRLINTRHTHNHIRTTVTKMLNAARDAVEKGMDVEKALYAAMEREIEERHQRAFALGRVAAEIIEDGDSILNHCWAESGIVYTLYVALQQGKKITAYCSETRPYLQGARLTADAIAEMGVPTTVITDNMPAFLMSKGMITKFLTGADRVTMDGHVINKIGTFQIALCAHQLGVPYYTLCYGPDPNAPTPNAVNIEEQDPEEVLRCLGIRTASPRARGYYPAFDITHPKYVSAIITDRGIFSPYVISTYHESS